ncbi:MAG: hypothetical protein KAV00_17925 [Phycisphaerae bacterium]|nr:hypothetical protein [Phycisphaerae bacterium]
MNKTEAIKLLGGTLARGILWATAALTAKTGVENIPEDTAVSLGAFTAAIIIALASAFWSRRKDKKLLQTAPQQ